RPHPATVEARAGRAILHGRADLYPERSEPEPARRGRGRADAVVGQPAPRSAESARVERRTTGPAGAVKHCHRLFPSCFFGRGPTLMRSLASVALIAFGSAAALAGPAPELRFCLHAEPKTFNPLLVDDDASETIRYLTG